MLGPLPRLHRWTLIGVCVIAGALLGAWIADLSATTAPYACSDVLTGTCLAPTINLLPVLAGIALGLLIGLGLVHQPQRPVRHRNDTVEPPR